MGGGAWASAAPWAGRHACHLGPRPQWRVCTTPHSHPPFPPPPQLVINNAGVADWADVESVTAPAMAATFQVNAVGPLLVTQALLKAGLLGKGSTVANMTSKAGDGVWGGQGWMGGAGEGGARALRPPTPPRPSPRRRLCPNPQMGSCDDNTSGGTYPYRASKARTDTGRGRPGRPGRVGWLVVLWHSPGGLAPVWSLPGQTATPGGGLCVLGLLQAWPAWPSLGAGGAPRTGGSLSPSNSFLTRAAYA